MIQEKAQIYACLDACIKVLGEYYDLPGEKQTDKKEALAQYYSFTQRLNASLSSLDAETARLASQIQASDACNDYARVKQLSRIFELTVSARKLAEEFLVSTEQLLKGGEGDTSYSIKNSVNVLIKKLFLTKSSL